MKSIKYLLAILLTLIPLQVNAGFFSGSAGGQALAPGDSPTFVGVNLTGLTASKPVFTDGSKNLTSSGTVPLNQGGTGGTTAVSAMNALMVKGADFAGATVNLATATGNVLDITTDTTAISTFGTVTAGNLFYVRFTSVRDITYNVTSMITPGARTITTAVGDTAILESLGSGNWLMFNYRKGDGRLLGDLQVVTVSSTRNLTVNEMTGQKILVTGAYVPAMPSAVVGRNGTFVATTAVGYSVDVAVGTDVIYLNGVAQAAGEKVTSDGTIRASLYCECFVTGIYDCVSAGVGLFINGG